MPFNVVKAFIDSTVPAENNFIVVIIISDTNASPQILCIFIISKIIINHCDFCDGFVIEWTKKFFLTLFKHLVIWQTTVENNFR